MVPIESRSNLGFRKSKTPIFSVFLILLSGENLSIHLCTIVSDVRTFFCENPEISIPLLPKPRGRRAARSTDSVISD